MRLRRRGTDSRLYKGDAESTLSVVVMIAPVNWSEPEELPPATVIRSKPISSGAGNSYQD